MFKSTITSIPGPFTIPALPHNVIVVPKSRPVKSTMGSEPTQSKKVRAMRIRRTDDPRYNVPAWMIEGQARYELLSLKEAQQCKDIVYRSVKSLLSKAK